MSASVLMQYVGFEAKTLVREYRFTVRESAGDPRDFTLTITNDISQYTRASVFSAVGKKTEVLLRFSTVAGERGAADAERDVRGFALKFYTDEGNWDVVGNNTPVFFIRDPLKFPDFIRTQKRHPAPTCAAPPRCGTSGRCHRKACTRSPS